MKKPTKTISIVNWDKFQHYSKRRQIWVKFYVDLLDNYDYCNLKDDCKLLLHHLWLLASCYQNNIVYDLDFLKRKIPVNSTKICDNNISILQHANFIKINPASNVLASCYQVASLEENRIEENRIEDLGNSMIQSNIPLLVLEYFNLVCKKNYSLTNERKKVVEKCLSLGRSLEDIKVAIDNFSRDTWPDRCKFMDLVYAIGQKKGGVDNFDKWFNASNKPKQIKSRIGARVIG